MCCILLRTWWGSLGEVKIKMSEIKKALPSHPQRCAMGWKLVLEMYQLPGQTWQQSLVLLPAHPVHTNTLPLSTREVYMLSIQKTRTSGKQSSTEFPSPFPSISFNIFRTNNQSKTLRLKLFVLFYIEQASSFLFLSELSTHC